MIRMMLSDAQWDRIEPLLPGKAGDPGRSGTDNRLFLEAVLWLVRTGVPWRDLPEAFGRWNFRRFRRWACKGVFESLFTALSGDPDFEYAIVDGTIVRVHQHGAGAKGGTQAIGRSRCGLTTKIVALVDALVLQPVLIGLGAALPVGATSPLLMAPAPDRPSDSSGWSGGREADQTGEQGADLRDGEGQQVDFEVGRVLSPRWPPLGRW